MTFNTHVTLRFCKILRFYFFVGLRELVKRLNGETTMSNLSGKGVLILNEGLQHYRPHALINFSLEVCKRQ